MRKNSKFYNKLIDQLMSIQPSIKILGTDARLNRLKTAIIKRYKVCITTDHNGNIMIS